VLRRDVRHALRGLGREPMFAATAILTLALGVAATTTVFSVADAELWKALPYPEPEKLVAVVFRSSGDARRLEMLTGADFTAVRSGTTAFSGLAGIGQTNRRTVQLDTAQPVIVSEVSPSYFDVLGRHAVAGRTFTPDDARGRQALVFTDRGWQRLFGTDPAELELAATAITLDGESVVVVGVVPADDSLGPDPDAYLALDEAAAAFRESVEPTLYGAIGRLAPDASADVARGQAQAAVDRARRREPGEAGHVVGLEDLNSFFNGFNPRPLYFFLGASLIVLVLSAVNIAALLVGRALRRRREFALLNALGGGPAALGRRLLVEAACLAGPGCVLGLFATTWILTALDRILPADSLARGTDIPLDIRVAAFGMVTLTLVTAFLALVPWTVARTVNLAGALGPGNRVGRTRGEGRARALLLAGQIAMTMVLVTGAALFVRSYLGLIRVPLGFDPRGVVAARVSLTGERYDADASVRAYANALVEAARALPGVRSATVATSSPLGSGPPVRFTVRDRQPSDPDAAPRAILRAVGPEYFDTLGIRVVRGRSLADTDTDGAERVAVVNEALVDQVFPGEEPIGRVIELLADGPAPWTRQPGPVRIVGVVENTKEIGINEMAFGNITMPFTQLPAPFLEVVARVDGAVGDRAEILRRAAAGVDPAVPVIRVSLLSSRVEAALEAERFNLAVVAVFASLAVLIAGIGIYGAASYYAEVRQREFGVRLAIGATPRRLVIQTLAEAARLGATGALVGLGAVFLLARAIGNALYLVPGSHSGLLYGVTTTDPQAIGAATLSVVALAILAALQPARRAGRVDPAVTLRSE